MDGEPLFRSVYEHTEVLIFVLCVDVRGDFVFGGLNPACEKATGLRNEDVVGKRPEGIPGLSEDISATLRAHCQRCLESDEVVRFDWPLLGRRQGTWWMTELAPVRDEAGRVVQIVGSSTNVTQHRETEVEREQTEEALRKSEKRVRRMDDAMLSTEGDIGTLELSDIIDSEKIQMLMDEFYRLTHIGIGIIDLHGRVLVGTGWQDVCTRFHRINPESCRLCIESDLELSRNVPLGTFKRYRCKNNMWDIATPIMLGDRHVGNIFLGQFLFDDETPDYEVFRAQAKLYGFNEDEYIAALDRVPRWSHETVTAAMSFYAALAGIIGNLSYSNIRLANALEERKQAEEALRRSNEEKTILNQIADIFLTTPDEAMYGEVLAIVLQVMKSTFGIFGYVGEGGDLIVPSMTRDIWDKCQVANKSIVFPADSWGYSLWGKAIREKRTFCSDGPFRTPEGHIRIDCFLTVPIVFGRETIGVISVANKKDRYTEEDTDLLERIVSRVSPILQARLQRDVQERRRVTVEGELRESEEKYRLLIENADEAIFILQDGFVNFPNPKTMQMTGHSSEELADIPFVDLVHSGDRCRVSEGYMRPPDGERDPKARYFRLMGKRREEMWVQLTTAPIIWNKKPGILCFLRDVTEEKKLEARFLQAQKMEAVGRLAGGVAHDFNNMLTVIIGHADLALTQVTPSNPLHAPLQEIAEYAGRSADLTRQLLAFARKQTIAPSVMDLNTTVSGMLNMLRRLIGEDIDLVWVPGEELWPIKMDAGQVSQVLANLCVNARDAIAGVGKVTVETANVTVDEAYCSSHPGSVCGEYVQLAVSDDGCGMNEETQAHLFEPFFTTKGMGQGTGLGLATVYGVVSQNDGFINVYSEPGQGATFKVYFPRHEREPASTQAESTTETPSGNGEMILVIEDEEAILNLIQKVLERLGYAVLTTKTPGDAIRLTEEYTGEIHLMITDVVMPEMNGRDLADLLVSIRPGLKCLYMSGYTANVIAHRGVLKEGIHFIQKPFSVRDIAIKVRETLNRPAVGNHGA